MNLLEINKLTAFYGDFQALFEIDFAVGKGEAIAIIGANGAGKSTFMRSISGVVPVKREAIKFDGKAIGGLAARDIVKSGIALVPEGRRLFSSLSVEENLLMGACSERSGNWHLDSVYHVFPKLKDRRKQMATSMSGGEQQMVAIGRALMANPQLLMCDEISLGLAPKIIGEMYEILAQIRQLGTTMIIVEQDIRQAMAFADRVYCFQEGRVSLEGKPSALSHEQISQAYFGV
jgi:branched-chain amino acid transport system ATP-binding protein